jgi:hypothetical protein
VGRKEDIKKPYRCVGKKGCALKDFLIRKINAGEWWHVTPRDPDAYNKRGKFFASTYLQAQYYGKPTDTPEKVTINNPVFGFSEEEILKQIIPYYKDNKLMTDMLSDTDDENWYDRRITVDATMFSAAKKLGYDSIILICRSGYKALIKNRKPNSIELNLLNV